MTTISDLRTITGLSIGIMSDTTLTEMLSAAQERCSGYLSVLGCGAGGSAYEAAVKYYALSYIYRNLDIRGIKPQTLTSASITINSDIGAAVMDFEKQGEEMLRLAYLSNAPNKRDMFIKRLRGGRGVG